MEAGHDSPTSGPARPGAGTLAALFLRGASRTVPRAALLGCLCLSAAGLIHVLATGGGGGLVVLAGAVGFIGGAIVGFLGAARGTLAGLEEGLRAQLPRIPLERIGAVFPSAKVRDLRERAEAIVERVIAEVAGLFSIPSRYGPQLRRPLRGLFDRLLADCDRRGVAEVGPPEVREWLVSKGLALATAPLFAGLRTGRRVVFGLLALAGAALVATPAFCGA
ncbi:MAG: hypothetical protein L0323_19400 [Planctomycetes bacterium]|nr:hypothetical protein [Planctomycetota bacterium]